jgi:hypothetical protein
MQIRIIFNVIQESYPINDLSERKTLLKLKSPGTPKTSFNPISDNRRRMYSEIVMVGVGEIGRLMFDGFQEPFPGLYISCLLRSSILRYPRNSSDGPSAVLYDDTVRPSYHGKTLFRSQRLCSVIHRCPRNPWRSIRVRYPPY